MTADHIPVRRHGIAALEAFDVTADELDTIERECKNVGLDFQVAVCCITGAISFLVAILTSTPKSRLISDSFVIVIVLGFALGAVFLLRWRNDRGLLMSILARIRDRQLVPAGDESHQLRPAEIAQLQPIPAPPVIAVAASERQDPQPVAAEKMP